MRGRVTVQCIFLYVQNSLELELFLSICLDTEGCLVIRSCLLIRCTVQNFVAFLPELLKDLKRFFQSGSSSNWADFSQLQIENTTFAIK